MSETCFNCVYNRGSMCTSISGCHFTPSDYFAKEKIRDTGSDSPDKSDKEHLDKLINDHWEYIEGVLYAAILHEEAKEEEVERIREIEYHYKTSGKHFWKHACEYYGVGNVNS